jgi:hypothetical protein
MEDYPSTEVDRVVDIFKDLVNKNQINAPENDIGFWSRKQFWEFREFVTKIYDTYQKLIPLKKTASSSDYPILYQNDQITIYGILSKAAACKLGSDSPWCISKQNQHYYEWHVDHGYKMIMCVPDDRESKITYIENQWKFSIWDMNNKSISKNDFLLYLELYGVPDTVYNSKSKLFNMVGKLNEIPNYDVPNGEDDDGEWSEPEPEDGGWEEDEDANEAWIQSNRRRYDPNHPDW